MPTIACPPRATPIRLGVVSFLNTLPLIDGLDVCTDVELRCTVPSLLIDQLLGDEVDIALCSSIDYLRSPEPLRIVPVGMLGCCGPTMTVRLYSAVPIETLERVYCDTDSHTSVALLRILLRDRFGVDPELVDYDAREHVADNKPIDWPTATLLIGDKVVTDSPPAVRYPHQLDLGEVWHEMTGLPFVFATWLCRADADPAVIAAAASILDRERRRNAARIPSIVRAHAAGRSWPADLANDYLGARIVYDLDDGAMDGLRMFYEKAGDHGLAEYARTIKLF